MSSRTSASGNRTGVVGLLRHVAVDVRPLRLPAFRRLWVGNAVSYIGIQVTAVAVPVQMYEITRSSLWVGLLGLAGLLPLVGFAVWGGAVADIVDRRRLYLTSSLFTWLVTVCLVVQALLRLDNPFILLTLVALQAVGFAISSPTRTAIVPRLVPAEWVPAANTLNFTASSFGSVAGPLLAGVVLSAGGGFTAAYALDAVLFTVVLWAAVRLPALPPEASAPDSADPTGNDSKHRAGWASIAAGLRFITGTPVVWLSFAVDILAMLLAMPRALFPEVAESSFGGEQAVGWLYSAIAVGSVLGGLMSGWIGRVRRQGVALVAAVLAWGAAVALAGLAPSLWLAVLLLAVAGFADLVSAVYRQTILQLHAPDRMRGRMQGVFVAVVAGGPRLGDLRAGATAALAGPTVAWVGGGVACVIAVVALTAAFPSLLRYDGRPSPEGRPE